MLESNGNTGENIEYTLIPTKVLNRLIAVLEKLEPLVKDDNRWISQAEAMKLLNCKYNKLYQLRKSGEIKYRAMGGKNILIDRKSIDAFNSLNST